MGDRRCGLLILVGLHRRVLGLNEVTLASLSVGQLVLLFSGLYPHSNGMLENDMSPVIDAKTIGQRLAINEIRTGYIEK